MITLHRKTNRIIVTYYYKGGGTTVYFVPATEDLAPFLQRQLATGQFSHIEVEATSREKITLDLTDRKPQR